MNDTYDGEDGENDMFDNIENGTPGWLNSMDEKNKKFKAMI